MVCYTFLKLLLIISIVIYVDAFKRVFEIRCEYDNDCVRNSYCNRNADMNPGGICVCREDFILQTNRTTMDCLPTPHHIGDRCEKDIQCQVSFGTHAVCSLNDNTCQCAENTHFEEGICYKNGKIGDACNTSEECYIENTLTYCLHSKCVCHSLFHPNVDGTKCIKSKQLDQTCKEHNECIINNSRCLSDRCRCKLGFIPNANRDQCLNIVINYKEPCIENNQCTAYLKNAQCRNDTKLCDCDTDYHLIDDQCWKNVGVYDFCEHRNECVWNMEMENITDCVLERCICKYQYDKVNGVCLVTKSNSNRLVQFIFNQLLLLMFYYLIY